MDRPDVPLFIRWGNPFDYDRNYMQHAYIIRQRKCGRPSFNKYIRSTVTYQYYLVEVEDESEGV